MRPSSALTPARPPPRRAPQGFVTVAELSETLGYVFDHALLPEQLEEIAHIADQDGDGRLGMREMADFLAADIDHVMDVTS